jgi:hypothetical protein
MSPSSSHVTPRRIQLTSSLPFVPLLLLLLLIHFMRHTSGILSREQPQSFLCDMRDRYPLDDQFFESSLRMASRSQGVTPHRARLLASMTSELVVAWCREDLSWLEASLPLFTHTTVYSKCESPLPQFIRRRNANNNNISSSSSFSSSFSSRLHVEAIANVGSCDRAYLHHITLHWRTLAEHTVFYKATVDPLCAPSQLTSSSTEPNVTFRCCDNRVFSGEGGNRMSRDFVRKRHHITHHTGEPMKFHKYIGLHGTMGHWVDVTFGRTNADALFAFGPKFCFGGYFAAHRDAIRRQSVLVYEVMRAQQHFPNEEVDHYIERLWHAILKAPPIHCEESK